MNCININLLAIANMFYPWSEGINRSLFSSNLISEKERHTNIAAFIKLATCKIIDIK